MGLLVFDKDHNTFVFKCVFSEREIAKQARFTWDDERKFWHEPNYARAWRLKDYATESAKTEYERRSGFAPLKNFILTTPKSVDLYRHQREAVRYILERRASYYAGEPGVGKTAVAITAANSISRIDKRYVSEGTRRQARGLVICPPFLALNWKAEIKTFGVGDKRVEIISGKNHKFNFDCSWTICPDSLVGEEHVRQELLKYLFDILFIDEAHRFKNEKAIRTTSVLGGRRKIGKAKELVDWRGLVTNAERVVCLSGTPMPNKPVELWPILSTLAPHTISGVSFFEFVHKYCAAYKDEWGWHFDGASNIEELNKNVVGPFMLRHAKEDCLDLPDKIIRYHHLDENIFSKKTLAKVKAVTDDDLFQTEFEELGAMATIRNELGQTKARHAVDFILEALEEESKVVIFTWHQKTMDILAEALEKSLGEGVVLTNSGKTPKEERHKNVHAFQTDKRVRVFIGQIQTMVGITLHAASRGIFIETSWVPGDNDQAMDRLHRIGQKTKVVIDLVTFPHDLDVRVFSSLNNKRRTINKFLNQKEI